MSITDAIEELKRELLKKNDKAKVVEFMCKAVYVGRPLTKKETDRMIKEVEIEL